MTTENINLAKKPFGPENGEYYTLLLEFLFLPSNFAAYKDKM